MSYQLASITRNDRSLSAVLNPDDLRRQVERISRCDSIRFRRLWNYYRNPLLPAPINTDDSGSDRPYRQAQEWGLPSRITGVRTGSMSSSAPDGQPLDQVARKEVVIENDIAWRIDTHVDYLFGRAPVISSSAADDSRRAAIEQLLQQIIAHNGGIVFLQQLALMGAVYGFVDVLVKLDASDARNELFADAAGAPAGASASAGAPVTSPAGPAPDLDALSTDVPDASTTASPGAADPDCIAQRIRLEIVEPARALPFLDPDDYRDVLAYGQVYPVPARRDVQSQSGRKTDNRSWIQRVFSTRAEAASDARGLNECITVIEIITPTQWQKYEDEKLVASGANSLGELPLVHIQNSALPFEYAGGSDVEPLLALQDELNTRLSDRAHRITMQSFKMYLGIGIDNFGDMPVSPGRMWMTDNADASVEEFGGDARCPSEDSHIREIREALDKTSSVTPIAAGAIKNRIGQLTSAAALRVTMMALLAKTERKRTLYGDGLKRMFELALAWLDRAGLFATTRDERRVELSWPSVLPTDDSGRLADAEAKVRLGIPRDIVLRELGYEQPQAK